MIVISFALVLVAGVLLLLGIASPDLTLVYASIGVSLGAFVFLLIGVLQRRKESPLDGEATGELHAGLGAVARTGDRLRGDDDAVSVGESTDVAELTGSVLVVAGRPRYHAEGCRYLIGKESSSVEVSAAREEGFSACGVCKPDAQLAAAMPSAEVDNGPATTLATSDRDDQISPAADDSAEDASDDADSDLGTPVRPRRAAGAPRVTSLEKPSARGASAAAKAPAKAARRTPAKAPTKSVDKAAAKPAVKVPAKAVVNAPVKAAKAPAKAAKAPAKAPAKTPAKAAKTPAKKVPAKTAPAKTAPVKKAPAKRTR